MFLTGRSLLDAIEMMSMLPLNDPRTSPKACFALLQTIVEYRDRLTSWYTEREVCIGGAPLICGEKDSRTFNKALLEENPFGSFYQFSSLDNARLHILYWTAMNLTHTLVYRAQMMVVSINRTTFPADNFPVDPSNYESFALAGYYIDQVCRSIPYCMQPMHRIWGTHVVFGTIDNVIKSYTQHRKRDKFLWCQRVLDIAGALGLGMALYFSGTAKREWDSLEANETFSQSPSYVEVGTPDVEYHFDEFVGSPGSSDLHQTLQFQDIPVLSYGEISL